MFLFADFKFTCKIRRTSIKMADNKQGKEEQTISMTQMAEMMQTIQSMSAEMKPQLVTLTNEIKEIKQNQQQQISHLKCK